jgi:hypothetical protein
MSFQDLVTAAQQYFPDLQIKYKNQSLFMKILGMILFFNPTFMTSYITTIGSTVYFPNTDEINNRPNSAAIVLLHELVHIHDSKKWGRLLFSFLYLTPQVFLLLAIPALLIIWKIALVLFLLFALPFPSYFRMLFEKRAYLTSLYVLNAYGKKQNFPPLLASQKDIWIKHFKDSSYYFMWTFSNIDKDFDAAVVKIQAGQRPFEDPVFDIIDNLIAVI